MDLQAGDPSGDVILVERGTVQIIPPSTSDEGEAVGASYGPRQFSGELNLLTQQAACLSARASQPSAVVRIGPAAWHLRALTRRARSELDARLSIRQHSQQKHSYLNSFFQCR